MPKTGSINASTGHLSIWILIQLILQSALKIVSRAL
jgi:hypothetical protein